MKARNVILKVSAVVLTVLYVLSLGGINVHTCSHTGARYVTFLFEGTTCQQIHPSGHHCHHEDGCCHCGEDHDCNGEDGCCTNVSRFLTLTGSDDASSQAKHLSPDSFDLALAPVAVETPSVIFSAYVPSLPIPAPPLLGPSPSSICVLRV